MRRILWLLPAFLLLGLLAHAQNRTITGRVTDAQGKPVPFASVTVKGTNTGVAADANGNFTIQASPNATLVFSAAGFQSSETNIGTQTTVNVSITSQGSLSEVVVTALGIRRNRNTLPYAAQQVNGDEVTKTRTDNFVNSLSGKVSGLNIKTNNNLGGSTNVIIRGYKSLTGNNQALFVIDGVPVDNSNTNSSSVQQGFEGYDYGNAAADINPDDIESINVLKGAAATALYGSRAGNGVILIETKKGRRGLGIVVNTGVSTGRMDRSTWVHYQHEYGAGYYDPNYYHYSGTNSPDRHFLYKDANGDGTPDLIVPTTEDASFGAKFDPNLLVYHWYAFDPTSPNYLKPTPWVAAANDPTTFFENPFSTSNSVLVDGSNDKGYFKLGYTLNHDKGILPNSKLNKNLFVIGGSYKITDKLTATTNINFSVVDGLGRYGSGYSNTNNVAGNFREWWQMNVDIMDLKDAYERTGQNITWNMKNVPSNTLPIYWDNPYFSRYKSYETDNRYRTIGVVSLAYNITDWLNVLGRGSIDTYDELQEERQGYNSINIAGYNRYNRTFRQMNYDLILNMDRDLSSDFNLKALAGANLNKQTITSIYASTNGGLVIPDLYSLSNSLNSITPPSELEERLEVGGVFAGITLDYRRILVLDATARNDKSSTLPAGNNSYFYPSISGSFLFSNLMKDVSWLSLGKLRVNYASVGNGAPWSAIYDVYDKPTAFGSVPLFSVPNVKNNPDLVPERTNSYEAGLDMEFLRNRAGFDITFYKTNTINQIIPVSVSSASGYSSRFVNSGNVQNKGIELTAYGMPVRTSDFSWRINVNWTKNKNKVLSLYSGVDNLLLGRFQGGVTVNATVGQPYGTLRGSDFIYTNGQKTVDADGYYEKTATSNTVLGDINPDWQGGINNELTYKSLSLSFLVDIRKGGSIFSVDQWYGQGTGLYESTAGLNDLGKPKRDDPANGGGVIFPGVTEDGKVNTKHALITGLFGYGYNNFPNAGYIYDAGYVKLREVNLAYSLPSKIVSRLNPFKGIELSLYGRNLWIIHKNLPDADPEEGPSSGNIQGVSVGSYPTYRTVGFNLKLKF